MGKFIPVSEPWLTGKELEYVQDAIKSTFISSEGKYIEEFERKFASYIGRKFGVACSSGTNALILALRALEIEKGSEVILPSFTIISCALAVIYNDLIPVFVDSDMKTWNMNPDEIERKITYKN
jgi:Predicted pyridoxal phosphate-dependent enzyme apparently involved in regulation of cell wall biogenesis